VTEAVAARERAVPRFGRIRAIFYDVGGTLLETVPTPEDFTARISEALGTRVDPERLKEAFPDLYSFINTHEASRGGKGSAWRADHTIRELWIDFYLHSFEKAGVVAPEAKMRQIAGESYDWYTDPELWRPYPDVVPAFEAGRDAGLIQGVISDWGTDLLAILQHLGLTSFLDFVVSSAVVGWAKPHPQIFLHALARGGVNPDEAVYVGDFYVNDILGARSVGIHPVLLDREGTAPKVDCPVIRTLGELPALVGKL
jgi:REG-2-like HAD superfamily hydrolase